MVPVPSGPVPQTPRARWPVYLCLVLGVAALVLLALVVAGGGPDPRTAATPLPAQTVVAVVPTADVTPLPTGTTDATPSRAPAKSTSPGSRRNANGTKPTPAPAARTEPTAEERFAANDRTHVRADWVAGFYRLYETAGNTFGVPWLLLASIHKQETAFSTAPGTYKGLNFANCCAGPMQFNVTNGPVTTWERVNDAHLRAARPATYNRMTEKHPSVYDDFDAMMAAARLLQLSGAQDRIDATSWRAAYDYYGHDLTGVDYASRVVARAMTWAKQGFRVNGDIDPSLLSAVDAAWGAPVRNQLTAAERAAADAEQSRPARAAKATAETKAE